MTSSRGSRCRTCSSPTTRRLIQSDLAGDRDPRATRRPHERVLAVAVADLDGHRGVFAVTDQRFIHVAANRPEPSVWAHRSDIATVETSTGIRGTTPDPRPGTRNRVGGPHPPARPRRGAGRAAHADHRPLPVTPGHVVIGGPINRSASILGLWRRPAVPVREPPRCVPDVRRTPGRRVLVRRGASQRVVSRPRGGLRTRLPARERRRRPGGAMVPSAGLPALGDAASRHGRQPASSKE